MNRQLSLFAGSTDGVSTRSLPGVQGLQYREAFLSAPEQRDVLAAIDSRSWQNDLRRRVQHYGYRYDYKTRRLDESMYLGSLPEFARKAAERLVAEGLVAEVPDQVIVNEYLPGQGIAPHVDCEPCFAEYIVTVSLGSVYVMDLYRIGFDEVHEVELGLGSALVLSGDARYKWRHGIKPRKMDHGRPRGRRVSLTFRKVILARS